MITSFFVAVWLNLFILSITHIARTRTFSYMVFNDFFYDSVNNFFFDIFRYIVSLMHLPYYFFRQFFKISWNFFTLFKAAVFSPTCRFFYGAKNIVVFVQYFKLLRRKKVKRKEYN